jgi:GNAT superfamily N-acetyltransferase
MLDYARLAPGEVADRIAVTVTFLHMAVPAPRPAEVYPPGARLVRRKLSVAVYRKIYDQIGGPWLWWLRRVMPDELLARHLAHPAVSTHLLTLDGKVAGFFELERSAWPDVNLNYFGLMPEMVGKGLGRKLLNSAINEVASITVPGGAPPSGAPGRARRLTVNTCTADHPRALPNYLEAGFTEIRRAREIWDIPRRLGFSIPDRLRV